MDQKLLTFAGSDEPRDYFGLVICVSCLKATVFESVCFRLQVQTKGQNTEFWSSCNR